MLESREGFAWAPSLPSVPGGSYPTAVVELAAAAAVWALGRAARSAPRNGRSAMMSRWLFALFLLGCVSPSPLWADARDPAAVAFGTMPALWGLRISPDGSKIIFHSYRDGNAEIYIMNADGSNQTRLTNNPAIDNGPAWSP